MSSLSFRSVSIKPFPPFIELETIVLALSALANKASLGSFLMENIFSEYINFLIKIFYKC